MSGKREQVGQDTKLKCAESEYTKSDYLEEQDKSALLKPAPLAQVQEDDQDDLKLIAQAFNQMVYNATK